MARGQKIDELYISLGLDIARLQLDFDTAGRTVSETISRLNSRSNQLKLKMDVDLAKLDGAGTELDKIKVKYEAINRQLDIQRKKEEILANVLKDVQKADKDGARTRYAETNLLKQQRQVAQLEAELRKLNAEMKTTGSRAKAMGQKLSAGFSAAKGGVHSLSEGVSILNAKTAALMAVFTSGAGLFNITHDAMQAGESIYRLTKRLHTTTAEAAQMSRVFSLAGTNIDSLVPLFARLDRQVESAGTKGNMTTEALNRFGIALTDEKGNLLGLNEQLERLAKGYRSAADAGMEEAFTAEVLGARGAALIPVLEQYDDLMEVASHVKTTGLFNPEEAHQAYLKWREMEMEAGQLKLALGSALLPVAEDLMPTVIDRFQDLIGCIQDNKESIEELAEVVDAFARASVDVLDGVADAMESIGINAKSVKETLHDIGTFAKHGGIKTTVDAMLVGAGTGAVAGTLVEPGGGTLVGGIGGAIIGGIGAYEAATSSQKFKDWQAADDALRAEKKAAKEAEKALQDESRAQKEGAKAARENAAAVRAAAKANEDLKESLFTLSHSDLENALHEAARQAEKFRQSGADAQMVEEYRLQKQAKIYEDFQRNVTDKVNAIHRTELENQLTQIDEEERAYRRQGLDKVSAANWAEASKARIVEQWETEVASKIDSIWKTSLENRLADIEREKKAWMQEGLDEVKAAKWAEKEKLDARRNAALEALKSQKKELEAFRKGGTSGLLDYLRESNGLTKDDLNFRPEELVRFQRARRTALEDILPNFAPRREREPGEIKITLGNEVMERLAGTLESGMTQKVMDRLNVSPTVNFPERGNHAASTANIEVQVNIENAVTQDNEGMRLLADHVADRIRPAVERALGGDSNSYSNW